MPHLTKSDVFVHDRNVVEMQNTTSTFFASITISQAKVFHPTSLTITVVETFGFWYSML